MNCEASGKLIFATSDELSAEIVNSDAITEAHIQALFQFYGLDPALSEQMGFGVNDRKILDKYVCLDIFDGNWIEIAKLLVQAGTENEVAGEFWDDYGGAHYFASNGQGETISFYFEEESDEMDQDDFDEEAYFSAYEKNKAKWASLIPAAAKGVFE